MSILNGLADLEAKNRTFEGTGAISKDTFQFNALIGSGSFGKVYKATSKKTEKNYAVKVLAKKQIVDLKLIDQLRNEIAILAKCDHENIIKIYGAFEDNSFVSLVMELATGGSLFKKLQGLRKFTEAQTVAIIGDVSRAICYLHSLTPPVLHRDLKPENVLISDGRYKIADFGWSNLDDEFRNTFCGTPDYLAPEMIRGDGHNDRLDVWTIGVLLYELLHGRPPFSPKEKPSDKRLAQKMIEKNILEGKIDFDPSISKEAVTFIQTLMNPESKSRPAAKEIFELDFLKNHGQFLEIKQLKLEHTDSSQSKGLIAEYKDKLLKLSNVNETLKEDVKNKNKTIETLQKELEALQSKVRKLEEDRRSFESNKRENELNTFESARAKEEITRLQQTTDFLYTRAKELASFVSNFSLKNLDEEQLKQTSENVLNYDSTFTKLKMIFKSYLEYKAIAKKQSKPDLSDLDFKPSALRFDKSPARAQRTDNPASTSPNFARKTTDQMKSADKVAHPTSEEIDKFLK